MHRVSNRSAGAALAALLLSSTSTLAQAPNYNWSGGYIGINAGYAWGNGNASSSADCPAAVPRTGYFCDASLPALIPNSVAVATQGSGSLDSSGFAGGAHAGYNWQSGRLVYGAEMDFGAFDLSASRSGGALYPSQGAGVSFRTSASFDTDWLMTLRGRAGWSMGNTLLFLTAGFAMSDVHVSGALRDNASITIFGADAAGAGSTSKLKVGYTIGGGAEWALSRNWVLRGEYLFVDLGDTTSSYRLTNPGIGLSNVIHNTVDLTAHIARLGVSYRF